MLGIAQKLFKEKGGTLPATPSTLSQSSLNSKTKNNWHFLNNLLAKQTLPYIDYALAERLLRDFPTPYPSSNESIAVLICHLSQAARKGHLCVRIDSNTNEVYPNPKDLWLDGIVDREEFNYGSPNISPIELQTLTDLIIQGASQLPSSLYLDVYQPLVEKTLPSTPQPPLCRLGNLYYFERYWSDETLFVNNFLRLNHFAPSIVLDSQTVQKKVAALQEQNRLLPEQSAAILAACEGCLTLICGGPGTGKTYTAGELIKVYWEAMSLEQQKKCEIALAAPTGKAAANLQKSLSRAIGNLTNFPQIQAKTLHALMGIRSREKSRDSIQNTLTADLVVVDESSMIDVHLLSQLFASLKPGARLILLGDPNQLPPVSAGMLFSDIINHLSQKRSKQLIELNKCLRTDLRTIVDFADHIKKGDSASALTMLSSAQNSGIKRLILSSQSNSKLLQQKELLAYALPNFLKATQGVSATSHPQELLEAFNHFRILSPLRQGLLGVDALNELFVRHLMPRAQGKGWFVAPIMLVHNDYRSELFNGEVGVLVRLMTYGAQEHGVQLGDYALFPGREEDGSGSNVRKLPALLLPKYEYAYCLSVHKSQGSEFDHVLLLMPEGVETFGREVFYTAVTRARKQLEVWGSDVTLSETMARRACRLSGIKQRLGNYCV